MEQAEEAAAEAEAQRRARFHLVAEARVVKPKLAHRGAQILELRGIDREQAAEHHRNGRAKAGQHFGDGLAIVGDGVADARVGHLLDRGGDGADLAGAELVDRRQLRREHPGAVHVVGRVGAHHADALALLQGPVDDANEHHNAEIGVVPAIDQQGLERRVTVALGRRQSRDDGLKNFGHAQAGLGRDHERVRGVDADHVLDLLPDRLGLGGRQVDLVEHRHDLMAGIDGVIDVGEGLSLDALARVHHQQRALAGRERAVHLIGEVDVAGRIDQVEDVILAVARLVFKADGLRLDGDAALALDVHGIEHLLDHLALLQAAGELDQAVSQRGLAVVDVGDDREIADVRYGGGRHGREITPPLRCGKHRRRAEGDIARRARARRWPGFCNHAIGRKLGIPSSGAVS